MRKVTKLCVPSLLALQLLHAAPTQAQPQGGELNWDSRFKQIETRFEKKEFGLVLSEVGEILGTPDLPSGEKVRFLTTAMRARLFQTPRDTTAAFAYCEKVLADGDVSNAVKLDTLRNFANFYIETLAGQNLDQMDLSPAYESLKRGLELPGLLAEERAVALTQLGALYARHFKPAEARHSYEQILNIEVGDATKMRARQAIAETYLDDNQPDAAFAIYREQGWDLEPLLRRTGDVKALEASFRKVLNDVNLTDEERWSAFTRLPLWEPNGDLTEIQRTWEAYMPAFQAKDPNRPLFLRGLIAPEKVSPSFVVWAAPHLLAVPQLGTIDLLSTKVKYLEALASLGKKQEVRREAESIAADARFGAGDRFWARLLTGDEAKAGGAKQDIGRSIEEENGLAPEEKAETVLRAARTSLRLGDDLLARRFYDAYRNLAGERRRASIDCNFVDEAPMDVGDWLASPLLKKGAGRGRLNRPYGDNLQLLLATDSAVSGRKAGQSGDATGDNDTDFYTVCDEKGVHLFLRAFDGRVQEVVDGLLNAGSFEIYLAPGERQAYYAFLAEAPEGRIDSGAFITQYPTEGFRQLSSADGTFRSESRVVSGGYALSIFLSWETFYNKLPADGDKWQFEAFRWTRSGGFSFGGSESVHNRSSFGDLLFRGLTPEKVDAIKRTIVFRAQARYRAAKDSTAPVMTWADPELGDPAFYNSRVLPLLNSLDAYATRVKKEMSRQDVELLFREAVPGWLEVEPRVAQLRTRYLEEKLLAR